MRLSKTNIFSDVPISFLLAEHAYYTVFSQNSGLLANCQLKHMKTSQNLLQVVRLDSSVLKHGLGKKLTDFCNKLTGPAGQTLVINQSGLANLVKSRFTIFSFSSILSILIVHHFM